MSLLSSDQRAVCADVARRWASLKAWYQAPANARNPAVAKIKANDGLFPRIDKAAECVAFDATDTSIGLGILSPSMWPAAVVGYVMGDASSTTATDVVVAKQDLELLEQFAIAGGYSRPAMHGASLPGGPTDFAGGGKSAVAASEGVERGVKQHPTVDYLTDPARTFPVIGGFDPAKKSPQAQYEKCLAAGLPTDWCEYNKTGAIPAWVYVIGAAGAAGFGLLAYTAFKSAPYVLSVMPETAPLGQAWLKSRQGGQQAY